jgi:3-oxoacyl-[acyl-carrier-protein] synthase-3
VVLEAQTQLGSRDDRGILATRIRSDGRFEDLLYVDGGPGSTKTTGPSAHERPRGVRHAVQKISGVIEETLVMTGYAPGEIDLYVPHQANKRILDGIAHRLGIAPGQDRLHAGQARQYVGGLDPAGAQSGARGPALDRGTLVLMEAMGGGLTWGAALARW